MVDVSAIIVNYNTGPYTQQLVDCLCAEPVTGRDGRPGTGASASLSCAQV